MTFFRSSHTREGVRTLRKPLSYRRMRQSQDPPQTGNAFASPKVSSLRPSLLSGEICVHPTEEVSRLQLRIKELPQKNGLSGGFLALLADTWRPLCARYWCLRSGEPLYLPEELRLPVQPKAPSQQGRWRGFDCLTSIPALIRLGKIPEKGCPQRRLKGQTTSVLWSLDVRYFGRWEESPKCFSFGFNNNINKKCVKG